MMTAVEIIGSLGGLGWIATVVGSVLLLLSILYLGIWRPYKLHTFYKSLHVKGPPHRPLVGNLADIWTLQRQVTRIKWETADPANLAARTLPHLTYWAKLYGRMFTYTEGAKVNLCVLDTEIIRELLVLKADCYRRSPSGWLWRNSHGASRQSKQDIIDNKMIHCEPERWSTLRRILGPGSDKDHVQDLIFSKPSLGGHPSHSLDCLQTIVEISRTLIRNWDMQLTEASTSRVTVEARREIKKISMEMLLTNLIGSTMTADQLEELHSNFGEDEEDPVTTTDLLKAHFSRIRSSRESWLIGLLTQTCKARLQKRGDEGDERERQAGARAGAAGGAGAGGGWGWGGAEDEQDEKNRDLLDLMISASGRRSSTLDVQKLVADCQMMVAAQKATTQLISQTLQLLARHPDWQTQARAEVLEVRPLDSPTDDDGDSIPNSTYPKLAKLKVMNMILNESLRLFPPILSTEKLCEKRHRLGKYTVLPGTFVQVPIVLLHHSPELWGDDALSFRPDRFEHGAGARRPFALLPFSAGPSVCLGYNFALLEAKIVLASVLRSFHFSPAPSTDPSPSPSPSAAASSCLLIRKLASDDVATAARQRLTRRHTSFL
ncbi:protein MpCYP734-like [Marchantia polymorpha subsp. ruderalis]